MFIYYQQKVYSHLLLYLFIISIISKSRVT